MAHLYLIQNLILLPKTKPNNITNSTKQLQCHVLPMATTAKNLEVKTTKKF